MEGASRVIRLELRLDGELPIGRASTAESGERRFAGWLGLIAAIDALAAGDRETGAGDSAQAGDNEDEIQP
jgi:hypothetical protein